MLSHMFDAITHIISIYYHQRSGLDHETAQILQQWNISIKTRNRCMNNWGFALETQDNLSCSTPGSSGKQSEWEIHILKQSK